MGSIRSSVDIASLSAWRGQLAAMGARRGLRAQLLQHRQELLPRFAMIYRQLWALPRRMRKTMQRRWGVSLAGVALTLTLQLLPGEAATFTAGTAAELVAAMTTANSNGEANTISLTADITLSAADNTTYGPTGLPVVNSEITIAGNHHTIRREPSTPDRFRLLVVNYKGNLTLQDTMLSGGSAGGEYASNRGGGIFNTGQLTLEGCTVSGNSADGVGGGVYSNANYGSTVQLMNSTVSGNSAGGGGGVFIYAGYPGHSTARLINSTISGNSADKDGGGALLLGSYSSTVQLLNSTVSDNSAGDDGGGVASGAFIYPEVQLINSMVSGNTAGDNGGGVYNLTYLGTVQLVNSTVSGNTAGTNGGGVSSRVEEQSSVFSTGVQIVNSTVRGNTAGASGGGVYNFASWGVVGLTNSTVSGNTASGNGGGVVGNSFYGTVGLTNSTVSGNTASGNGGGVHLFATPGGLVGVTSSTISGNTAGASGGGVYSSALAANCCLPAGTVELSSSLLSGNRARTGAEAAHADRGGLFTATLNLFGHNGLTTAQALSGVPAGGGNIVATSDGNKPTALADILDTTLQNNGGPTLTQNLVQGSLAIDAAGATCDLTTDQRGAPRPVDGNGDGVLACDIGAVEFGSLPPLLDCSTATASVDFPRLGNRHRYPVTISGVTASDGGPVALTINSIFQDEPVTNPTGKTCPDGIGVGAAVAKVRNERIITQAGDGRVYHLGFTATDEAGASCTGAVQVCVPVNEGEACGDQGALFDSTTCP